MPSFIIDDSHLQRLSSDARRELLQLLATELSEVRRQFADREWDPEGAASYPLHEEEAHHFVRGLQEEERRLLRVFCRNFDGHAGTANLDEMFQATGIDPEHYDELGRLVASLTQRLRSVTHNTDAWLFNWRSRDWEWTESEGTYAKGTYFISSPSIVSLRRAFGMEEEVSAG
jgi:hypothetical protein